MSLGCCSWGLENGCGDAFCSQMWNYPSPFWKHLLKDRNWSLRVNSLSQTVQAHPSWTDFIYPYYYLERIVLWMLLLSKVFCFSIDPKSVNLYWKLLCVRAVFLSAVPYLSQKVQQLFSTGTASTVLMCYMLQVFLDGKVQISGVVIYVTLSSWGQDRGCGLVLDSEFHELDCGSASWYLMCFN